MKLWFIGGTIAGLLGLSLLLAAVKRSDPAPPFSESIAIVPMEAQPATVPAGLPMLAVVEVADIDDLLDPPPIPPADPDISGPMLLRVGFEEPVPPAAGASAEPVKPIPKSVE